jgi:hypothetical protein
VIGSATTAGGAVREFTNIGPTRNEANLGQVGHIIITDADLRVDVTAVPSGMTAFRLHLYDVTPPSALGDNAAWDLPAGDRAAYLGYIDLGTPVDVGSTLFVQTPVNKKVTLLSSSVFGYLVTLGGYTPSNAAVKSVRLNAIGV